MTDKKELIYDLEEDDELVEKPLLICARTGKTLNFKDVKPGDRVKMLVFGNYIKSTVIDPKKITD